MLLRFINSITCLFLAAGLVFGSASLASAQDNYVIKPGDVLQIEVLEDSSLNRSTLVLPDGSIDFPMVGTIGTKGRTVEQVRQGLTSSLAPNFAAAPNVYVSVTALSTSQPRSTGSGASRNMDTYILGEVVAPGKREIKRGTTLLQFLAESGGLTRFAAEKRIELHRTDTKTGTITTYLFDYRSPGGSSSGINGSTRLAPGDVVKVPRRRLFE